MKPGCKTTSNSVFFFLGQETLSSSQLWLSPVCLLYFYIEHFISGHQVCRSLWEMWKFVSTSSKFLWHQLGVLQFSSILTLFIWKQPQIPQVKGQFYKPDPITYNHFRFASCKPRLSPVFLTHLSLDWSFLPFLPWTSDVSCKSRLLPVLLTNWL